MPYILATALFVQILHGAIIHTALPQIAAALGESTHRMQWVNISYVLAMAVCIPISGYMADKHGTRRIFLIAVFIFCIGSLLCAMSHNLFFLIVSRMAQGVGGAMMMPIARLILIKSYPREKLLSIMNYAILPAIIAPFVGPILGEYVVKYVSWQALFLINLPLGMLGLILGRWLIPNLYEPVQKFDWRGFYLFAMAAFHFHLSIYLISRNELVIYATLEGLYAFVLVYRYVRHARKADYPLFPLDLFALRTFRIGLIGNFLTRLGVSAIPLLLPLLLQVNFGYSAIETGWLLVVVALGAILIKPWLKSITKRLSYRRILVLNTTTLGLLIIILSHFHQGISWLWFMPVLLLLGVCSAIHFNTMTTITVGDLSTQQVASGNSLLSINQQFAVSFGTLFVVITLHILQDNKIMHGLASFQMISWILGVVTILSGLYFLRLQPDDGKGTY
ncbi:MFS transporter [Psychrobacter sp. I-STPA6b]|uniref:MFS transporter n=1 Tax=Psychrobacter sp. I-STPA6b TaxID=2585718 RepID=UPI001D0CCF02|nr:MFS transporter [Psychrobacter sp. I-STPA6b]